MIEYDIVIIGAGPAGLQAGIHTARRRHKVLILGKLEESALFNAHIENYFGFREKIDGKELILAGKDQVIKFGGNFLEEDAIRLEKLDSFHFLVETEKQKEIKSKALILALGVKKKKKIFKEEEQFVGKGLSYCVDCDAWFYRGKRVAVIGDGSAAIHGAQTLTNFASKVYFIPLREIPTLKEELSNTPIEIVTSKPMEIVGKEEVKGVKLEGDKIIEVEGIFIEMGAKGPP